MTTMPVAATEETGTPPPAQAEIIPVTEYLLSDHEPEIENQVGEEEPAAEATITVDEVSAEFKDAPATTPFFSFLDEHQKLISNRLQLYVQGIDNFFTDSTSIDERTGSYIRLRLGTNWPEGEGMEIDSGLSLKLRLPKTEEQLKLVVSSDVDEQTSALERETGETTTEESTGFFTGIESVLDKTDWKIRPSIGIKLRSPLDWYFRLKGTRVEPFDKWNLLFDQRFYWFDSSGSGSDTTMRWDRQIGKKLLFRSVSFLRYTDLNDYFEMSQTFSLIHTLSKKRAVTYKIGAFGQTEQPTVHATDYLVNLLYRSNIHKDYLFMDIQPQILFQKENEFKGQAEILVRLEIFYQG
ncbi:MAG: hypothetical protein PVG75_00275 [Thioalkalispiraceae bacterium]